MVRFLFRTYAPECFPIINSIDAGVNIVAARASPHPEPFDACRHPYP